ncbi:hypothetical protein [Amycolatopsis methanolica]|uniref:hypothetical protein n=1 Tax=Amycolatopsis methanolica TaxID=1814 RepID=UPI00341A00B3
MSTPEHTPAQSSASAEMEARQQAMAAIYEHTTNPTRTTRAISWAGWHLGELAGVTAPLGLAMTVWDGFYAVSGLVALSWAAHEVRLFLKQRAIRAAGDANSTETQEVQR